MRENYLRYRNIEIDLKKKGSKARFENINQGALSVQEKIKETPLRK